MGDKNIRLRQILGSNIRTARNGLGYSQQALAEKAEISTGHMNDIEQGRKWVSEQTLTNLAAALLVRPWMLLIPELSADDDRTVELRTRFNSALRRYLDAAIESAWEEMVHASSESEPDEHDPR